MKLRKENVEILLFYLKNNKHKLTSKNMKSTKSILCNLDENNVKQNNKRIEIAIIKFLSIYQAHL